MPKSEVQIGFSSEEPLANFHIVDDDAPKNALLSDADIALFKSVGSPVLDRAVSAPLAAGERLAKVDAEMADLRRRLEDFAARDLLSRPRRP
jgi:hypothetical protein